MRCCTFIAFLLLLMLRIDRDKWKSWIIVMDNSFSEQSEQIKIVCHYLKHKL